MHSESSSAVDLQMSIATGNIESYKSLFRSYYPRLVYFAMQRLHERNSAEEVVQAAFHKIWEKRKQLADVRELDSWIFSIVRLQINRYLSKRSLWHVSIECPGMDGTLVNMESSVPGHGSVSLYNQLTGILSQLPDNSRNVMHLLRTEGFTVDQVGRILHLSEDTVRAHLCTALEEMRNLIASDALREPDIDSPDFLA